MTSAVLSDLFIRKYPYVRPANWYDAAKEELLALELLPANWDGQNAAKPQGTIIASVSGLIVSIEKFESELGKLADPTIAPTRNGGILLEWNRDNYRLDVEFNNAHEARFACLDRATREQVRGTIYLGRSFPDEFSQCLGHFVD